MEIDHEIISTVILLPSAESFKKGCCQLQAKVCARSYKYWLTACSSMPRIKMWLSELVKKLPHELNNFCVLLRSESRLKVWLVKYIQDPRWLRLLSVKGETFTERLMLELL